jgi:hypothetical protein
MKIIVVAVAAVILVAVGLSCSDSETFTIQVKTSFEDYQEAKIYVNQESQKNCKPSGSRNYSNMSLCWMFSQFFIIYESKP